jgi:hypothetical protein
MFLSKLKSAAVVVAMAVTLGGGVGGWGYRMYAGDPPAVREPAKAAPDEAARVVLRGWGTALDPDGDCRFTMAQDKLTITVPGTDHALCIEQNRMNAPRVLRNVEGDFIAQVKVTARFPAWVKSVVPTRGPFHGAGLLLWKDAKTYVRLERAHLKPDDPDAAYANWELRKGGEFARIGDDSVGLEGESTWLRLERRGRLLFGSVSADGIGWTTLEPIEVDLPAKLQVGVNAGQNTSTGFEPTFEAFRLFQVVESP